MNTITVFENGKVKYRIISTGIIFADGYFMPEPQDLFETYKHLRQELVAGTIHSIRVE